MNRKNTNRIIPHSRLNSANPLVSLVIPIYNEREVIGDTIDAIKQALDTIAIDREIIIVDDGSNEQNWNSLLQLISLQNNIKIIRFSRNFGKESAIMAGIDHCSGDAAIILDGDLQHPPQLLVDMINIWKLEDVDIVDGIKESGNGESLANRVTSSLFHLVFRAMTGQNMAGTSDYKLLSRKAITALQELNDGHLYFRGMSQWLGFKHKQITFQVSKRLQGKSKWGTASRVRLAINALTSQTAIPLHLVTLTGLITLLFAFILGIQTLYNYFNGESVEGFTTVILLLLFFGSTVLLGLGIIGAYLSKILDEVRGRPRYLIQEIVVSDPQERSKSNAA